MKVSNLQSAELDFWVAKAEGLQPKIFLAFGQSTGCTVDETKAYQPSTDWALGGPIIERKAVELSYNYAPGGWQLGSPWMATIRTPDGLNDATAFGRSALIAAMRAYVASKFGDEVTTAPPPATPPSPPQLPHMPR